MCRERADADPFTDNTRNISLRAAHRADVPLPARSRQESSRRFCSAGSSIMTPKASERRPAGHHPWVWAILALGLGLRLYALDQPLVDWQAWRQTDTAAIARNFYEEGYRLFHPTVDWRGATPGYVEMNFPAYPFAVAMLYFLAGGVQEWLGRLLSALLSTGAGGLLFLLGRRLYADDRIGCLSALIYLITPLSLFFGRTFLPEGAMLFLSVGTLLSFDRWCEKGSAGYFFLAAVSAALCFLVKIPTLYLGFPLVAIAWSYWGWSFLRRPLLWLYLLLVLMPAVLWHRHAYHLFEQTGLTFGIWNQYGYDKWGHALLLDPGFYLVMLRRFVHAVYTPVGSLLVLLGTIMPPRRSREWIVSVWLGGLVLYLGLVAEGNRLLHYYQLPFVPVGALLAAGFLVRVLDAAQADTNQGLGRRLLRYLRDWRFHVLGVVLGSIAAYSAWAVRDYYVQPGSYDLYYRSCHALGAVLQERLPPDALLIVGDLDDKPPGPYRAQNPSLLYYSHRKGWQITPKEFCPERLDRLAAQGADYFVTATRFALQDPAFWNNLVHRGVTTAKDYPRFWTDHRSFVQAVERISGPERQFVVVRLRSN